MNSLHELLPMTLEGYHCAISRTFYSIFIQHLRMMANKTGFFSQFNQHGVKVPSLVVFIAVNMVRN